MRELEKIYSPSEIEKNGINTGKNLSILLLL